MTDRSLSTRAARAGGRCRLLTRAGVLAALLAAPFLGAHAQGVTWEKLPVVGELPSDTEWIAALGFLRGEGPAASNPAVDSLVAVTQRGVFLYNPSGTAGAAGSNGPFGPWHRLFAGGSFAGVVTSANTILVGSGAGATQLARGTRRGRTWLRNYDDIGADPFFEASVPSAAGPAGEPAVIVGSGDGGETRRSVQDGAPGTWVRGGSGRGFPESLGEVPASAALPGGRVLIGVIGGIRYSDDGGLTYVTAGGPGQSGFIVWSFTFRRDAAHPFAGVVYAGVQDMAYGEADGASVYRSDDGGRTWSLAHLFTAAETGQPPVAGASVAAVQVLATADGALWAGVGLTVGPAPRGGIMRSLDGGATWARADAEFAAADGRGWATNQLAVSRTGVLYAATVRGVWRTTAAVVAGEAAPAEAPEIGVSVRPNPASGRVEVVLTLAEAGPVRVAVVDALGREVAVVLDGAAGAGETVAPVETDAWPAGVYVVRVAAGAQTATARLVVAR